MDIEGIELLGQAWLQFILTIGLLYWTIRGISWLVFDFPAVIGSQSFHIMKLKKGDLGIVRKSSFWKITIYHQLYYECMVGSKEQCVIRHDNQLDIDNTNSFIANGCKHNGGERWQFLLKKPLIIS